MRQYEFKQISPEVLQIVRSAAWSLDNMDAHGAGGKMKDLKFMPRGKVYLTPGQRQARYIRMLERWVVALEGVCVTLMVLVYLLLF